MKLEDLEKNIRDKISISSEDLCCWLWTGFVGVSGYGQTTVKGKAWKAHRLVYTLMKGPIPDGFHIDHLCRVRHCVNPNHLEAVTHKVNVLRGVGFSALNASKESCPKGHPYSGENLYKEVNGQHRMCKICRRENYNNMYKRRSKQVLSRQKERRIKIAELEQP